MVHPQHPEPEVHEGGHRSGYLAPAAVGEGSRVGVHFGSGSLQRGEQQVGGVSPGSGQGEAEGVVGVGQH